MFTEHTPTLTRNALSFDLPVTLFKSEALSRLADVGPISPLKRLGLAIRLKGWLLQT